MSYAKLCLNQHQSWDTCKTEEDTDYTQTLATSGLAPFCSKSNLLISKILKELSYMTDLPKCTEQANRPHNSSSLLTRMKYDQKWMLGTMYSKKWKYTSKES